MGAFFRIAQQPIGPVVYVTGAPFAKPPEKTSTSQLAAVTNTNASDTSYSYKGTSDSDTGSKAGEPATIALRVHLEDGDTGLPYPGSTVTILDGTTELATTSILNTASTPISFPFTPTNSLLLRIDNPDWNHPYETELKIASPPTDPPPAQATAPLRTREEEAEEKEIQDLLEIEERRPGTSRTPDNEQIDTNSDWKGETSLIAFPTTDIVTGVNDQLSLITRHPDGTPAPSTITITKVEGAAENPPKGSHTTNSLGWLSLPIRAITPLRLHVTVTAKANGSEDGLPSSEPFAAGTSAASAVSSGSIEVIASMAQQSIRPDQGPASDAIRGTLETIHDQKVMLLDITQQGRIVASHNLFSPGNSTRFRLKIPNLPPGLYQLQSSDSLYGIDTTWDTAWLWIDPNFAPEGCYDALLHVANQLETILGESWQPWLLAVKTEVIRSHTSTRCLKHLNTLLRMLPKEKTEPEVLANTKPEELRRLTEWQTERRRDLTRYLKGLLGGGALALVLATVQLFWSKHREHQQLEAQMSNITVESGRLEWLTLVGLFVALGFVLFSFGYAFIMLTEHF